MKTTILICLAFAIVAAFVTAREREIPNIREDFKAEVSVELHAYDGVLLFGSGVIVRDGKSRAYQQSVMNDQMNFRLDRYDMEDNGIEYYFRGNKSEAHCSYIKPNRTKLFPFWDWVPNSSYIGLHEIEHRKMDLYESEVSGVRYVLGTEPMNASSPIYLERRNEFDDVIFTFRSFVKYDDKADGKYFDVPDQCK